MKIYVLNFAFGMSEEELHQAFEVHGQVEEVYMVTDLDTGRPRGFDFVEMATDAGAQVATTDLNGKEFGGRAITVNEARPRREPGLGR